MSNVWVCLAILGAALVAAGVALWDIPAALVVAGCEAIAVAYMGAYFDAKRTVG